MNTTKLTELLCAGREIEFAYGDKEYSVLPAIEGGITKIHFCEAYQPEHIFNSTKEFFDNAMIDDEKLKDIWKWTTDVVVF